MMSNASHFTHFHLSCFHFLTYVVVHSITVHSPERSTNILHYKHNSIEFGSILSMSRLISPGDSLQQERGRDCSPKNPPQVTCDTKFEGLPSYLWATWNRKHKRVSTLHMRMTSDQQQQQQQQQQQSYTLRTKQDFSTVTALGHAANHTASIQQSLAHASASWTNYNVWAVRSASAVWCYMNWTKGCCCLWFHYWQSSWD